ncbi:SusC/RagA family TonB-linked outer membrane protein [Sphingobacterium bambusae]|uniref:TonB-dependent receptor n=1 Tax=Sphingobacterium bambusae TaxID=662858 RepID=A0ABW6BFA5_9SPHI|nr:TonB-dependent receptor [Sphingobacterium bambusae]WPL50527.1 TonB-dependent receptor [Sphingobacterium bambusae]
MLKIITKSTFKAFLMLFCVMLSALPGFAQQASISGQVKDVTNGSALGGVTVVVKGGTASTQTAADGKFTLNVNRGAVLLFTYVGYAEQEITVGQTNNLDVLLSPSDNMLEELVVVGYGSQKRSDITGSVASVPKERLSRLPVTNVMQAIQGSVSNVNISQASSVPGDAPSTLVRGQNSMSGGSGPYIVVDGIPLTRTDGSINDINPNDIESVEVLKDPSAVAIYGVNGSNGVILITTKRGTTGKPTIRYSGYGGVEEAAHILEPVSGEELLNRYQEYARINNSALYNGGPVRNQFEYDNYINGTTTDWFDAVMQTGVIQNHNVGISGGSENARYFISTDYLNQKGILKGYNYKRYSFRANTDFTATKYLSAGTSAFIASHNRDGGRANLMQAAAMSPYAKMFNDDGTLTQFPMYSEQLWTNPLLPTTLNPERREFNVTLNGYVEMNFGQIWSPLAGLKYKFNGGYTFVPKRTNEYEGESVYNFAGLGRITNRESQTYTIENILTYTKDFGLHHLDFTGLYASKSKYYQEAIATGEVFPNDALGWGNLGSASTQKVSSFADLYRSISQMGRLNYVYDSRYMATLTVRRDGASVFGSNYKYGAFPSAALAWNIHNESFMANTKNVINNLKWRISYGVSGNEAITVYQALALMDSNPLAMGGLSSAAIRLRTRMGNGDLRWEKTAGFNTGVDFGLWNNRLTGTVEFYKTHTQDMLMDQNLPRLTGFDKVWSNLGKLENTGIDVTLTSKNVAKENFTWSTTVVFAHNKNKIVDIYGDGKDDLGNRWFIGHPVGVIYDYTKVGIWQEAEIAAGVNKGWDEQAEAGAVKLADLSGDGIINNDDRRILGQTAPKWTGGLTNTFTYKDFSLNVFITTTQGALRNNPQIGGASDEMGRRSTPAALGYWTPENQSNEWRSLSNRSNIYGYGFPSNASFTRLKDVTFSYNLPKTVASRIGIGGITAYASGRNLYTWTNWLGWDPEARDVPRGNSVDGVGDALNYPMVRTYVVGLNLTF